MKKLLFTSMVCLGCSASLLAESYEVYLGNDTRNGINRVLVDSETGTFSKLSIAAEASHPCFLVISEDQQFLYSAGVIGEAADGKPLEGVTVFQRKADGSLSQVQNQTSKGRATCHINLSADGKVLAASNYWTGSVVSYSIKPDGKLSNIASFKQHEGKSIHPQRQEAPHPHSVYFSPDSRFLYVADLGTDTIEVYAVDATTAKLKHVSTAKTPAGSGPRHVAFSSDGSQAFVLNELTNSVSQFKRNTESGALSIVGTTMLLPEGSEGITSSEIKISSDDQFLYAANRDLKGLQRDSISVLSLDANGAPTLQKNIAVGASIPRHIELSPDGKLLLVAAKNADAVIAFHRDPKTGLLKPSGQQITVEKPMWIGFTK
ncbi:lactonase family protein [Rubritalea marina]|uniref:lactonase family protein n=1 Tax=Rubritalea marina TaxID=361055 RepID=UPI0003632304|nr:lactonase family protein [Rubritalea marina]